MLSKRQSAITFSGSRVSVEELRIATGCSSEHYARTAQMQWTATGLTRLKSSMPPSRKHHNRIRDLVLQSAGRLFNRHGFNAVSIDDVMAEAGLTRGSFYCYFSSKSDLYAQSVARVVHEDREKPKDNGSERARADKIVHDYLSDMDHDPAADTFSMIGLPNDISRT